MAEVGIVTDSTCCMPPELIKEYGIRVVPYHLTIEGQDYLDQIDITPPEFWKKFEHFKELPTTGVPSPGHFAKTFTEFAESVNSIVCIHVSNVLSAVVNSAEVAKSEVLEKYPHLKIEFIDSKTSVGALGFVVLEAARAAIEGKNLEEIIRIANDMVSRVKYVAAFDTLKYLIRSGRAPKTAIIGEVLGVKPIIGLVNDTGLVQNLGKERGKQKAFSKLVDFVKEYTDVNKPLHIMVHYTNSVEDGETLKQIVISRYQCEEFYMTDLTPVMTAHTGPMVGLSFYS